MVSQGSSYAGNFTAIAQTTAGDIFQIEASSGTGPFIVTSIFYGQDSDRGDAEAEMARVTIQRASSTGTGGTGAFMIPTIFESPSIGPPTLRKASTPASGLTPLVTETFDWQRGFHWRGDPDHPLVIKASEFLVFRLETAPADELITSFNILIDFLF